MLHIRIFELIVGGAFDANFNVTAIWFWTFRSNFSAQFKNITTYIFGFYKICNHINRIALRYTV